LIKYLLDGKERGMAFSVSGVSTNSASAPHQQPVNLFGMRTDQFVIECGRAPGGFATSVELKTSRW
jgi:hypothetical protein